MRHTEKSLSQLSVSALARQDFNEHAKQLQRLEQLQKARLHRRKFLEGQVERHLLAETDLIHLAHARQRSDHGVASFTPAEEMQNLRETNQALRIKIREKQKLIQTLLKTQDRPGEKTQLQSLIVRNKQYLEEIKLRNAQFKQELQSVYSSDPRRENYKITKLKQRLEACQDRIEEYQQQQLKLRQRLDEQRQENSSLIQQNNKMKSVLDEYERELQKYREDCSDNLEQRLTFLLTENTQSAITIDNLHGDNIKLKEEVERLARALQVATHQYDAKDKELEQVKQVFREVKGLYNGEAGSRQDLINQLEKERQQVVNLSIQVKNLQALRQLEFEELQDRQLEVKGLDQQRSGDELRTLKVQYNNTVKQLTLQNEELVKQLENLFEMKSRNEEQHLKTLKLQEQLQTDLTALQRKLEETQPSDMKTLANRLQMENIILTGEKQQLLRELREKEKEKRDAPPTLTNQNSNHQRNISIIQHNNQTQHDDNNELQFLKDQLESGNKNLNLLKEQLQMIQHQDRIKGGQLRKFAARVSQLESELEQHKEFRESLDERITGMSERLRSKVDEVEELLDRNARQSQKIFQFNQKYGEMKAKLEEEVRFKALRIQQLESEISEKPPVELKDNQLDVARGEIMRLNQVLKALQEEASKKSAEKQSLVEQIVISKQIQEKLNDQISELSTRKALLQQQYQKHRQITDNYSTEREALKSRISSLSEEAIKYNKEIDRLNEVAEELLVEINSKQKEIQFLINQNSKIKSQTQQTLSDIKERQKIADRLQEETVIMLTERIQKNKNQMLQLNKKIQQKEKESVNKSKQINEQHQVKKESLQKSITKKDSLRDQKKISKGSATKPQPKDELPHQFIILLKDLQRSIKGTKIIVDTNKSLETQQQNLNILRQAQLLIAQLSRQVPEKIEQQMLLSQVQAPNTTQKQTLQKQNSHLKTQLSMKKEDYLNSIKQLEQFIVLRQKQLSDKISSLQSQLNDLKSQQRQQINWSDLKDVNAELQYSNSTLKRGSVKSQQMRSEPVDSLQNLEERNQARRNFQQELLELINKHLNFSSSKLAQLTFQFTSNLFLYPNHLHFIDFLERFLEGLKFYEEFESKRNIELKSTFMEYYGKAEELLEDPISQTNLLSDSLDLFPIRAGDPQLYSSDVQETKKQFPSRKASKSTLSK